MAKFLRFNAFNENLTKRISIIITLFVFNIPIVILLVSSQESQPSFLITVAILFLIFLVPGLAWLGLMRNISKNSLIDIFWTAFFISSAIMIVGNVIFVFLNIKSYHFLYYVAVVINLGILFTGWKFNVVTLFSKIRKKKYVPFLLFFLLISLLAYFLAGYYIPAFQDNTLTVQGTAYGLINSLKPHSLYDDGMKPYYFAHPLLLHAYGANAILLSGHLDQVKYYYDYSKIALRVQREGPRFNEVFQVYTAPQKSIDVKVTELRSGSIVLDNELPKVYLVRDYVYPNYTKALLQEPSLNINSSARDFLLVENKSANKHIIPRSLYEQIILRPLIKSEYEIFHNNSHRKCTRIVNIFFFCMTLAMIFVLLVKLDLVSPMVAFLLCLLFFSLPEVTVRSLGGSYTAISNFFLMGMVYFYVTFKKNNTKLSFVCALLAGLSNHKLVLFPLAILLKKCFTKDRKDVDNSILWGFGLGILVYWIYGFIVDPKIFLIDHFQHHFMNRIFHVSELGYAGYLTLGRYWAKFIGDLGWLFFVPSAIFLFILLKGSKKRLDIFSYWFLTGGFIFSVIDWKETKHLMLIVIPLLFGMAYGLSLLKHRTSKGNVFIKWCVLILMISMIAGNASLFITKSGYQMACDLGILQCLQTTF